MILIMLHHEINLKSADKLSELTNEKVSYFGEVELGELRDKTLTLLDLTADGRFQLNYSPNALAEMLIEQGLVKSSVEKIHLLVSDVNPKYSLISVASTLVRKFASFGKIIEVSTCGDVNYDASIIIYPEVEKSTWVVRRISDTDALELPYTYEKFLALKAKKVGWEGTNIYTWLNQPAQIFNQKRVYIRSESDDLKESVAVSKFISRSSSLFPAPQKEGEDVSLENKQSSAMKRKTEPDLSLEGVVSILNSHLEDPALADYLAKQLSESRIKKLELHLEKARNILEQRKRFCLEPFKT